MNERLDAGVRPLVVVVVRQREPACPAACGVGLGMVLGGWLGH
jgi:hypothetical protein